MRLNKNCISYVNKTKNETGVFVEQMQDKQQGFICDAAFKSPNYQNRNSMYDIT